MTTHTNEVLFIADPWDTLEHQLDSTLLLAREAQRRGLTPYWTTPQQIAFSTDGPTAYVQSILPDAQALEKTISERDLRSFDSLHWRVDPPVDLMTLRLWSLFEATLPSNLMINSARALLSWNEKFSVLRFRDWTLPTLFSESAELQDRFLRTMISQGYRVIVKPAAEAASRGVEILPPDVRRAKERLKEIKESIGPWAVLQKVDDQILQGEIRVFVLNGKVAGCLRKTPASGSVIMNWDTQDKKPIITPASPLNIQRQRAEMVGKELKRDGVLFATIDFIGDQILEINVTSPGLLSYLGPDESRIFCGWYWDFVVNK